MFARILKSGSFHDVVGYVTRQFFSHPLEQLKGYAQSRLGQPIPCGRELGLSEL